MWPIILSGIVPGLIRGLFGLFSARPKDQNNTSSQLEAHFQRTREEKEQANEAIKTANETIKTANETIKAANCQVEELNRQVNDAKVREDQANRREKEAQEHLANAHKREAEANRLAEEARIFAAEAEKRGQASREREEEAKRREDAAKRLAEESNKALLQAQIREQEAKDREEETKRREEEAKAAVFEAREQEELAKKELDRANFFLSKGIQPEVWPTEEQFLSAKTRIEYDPERLHFAICGSSGSGKSSLVNAFRGLKNFDPGAAPTGVIETTMSVTRYPDPHTELPRSRFTWFDIPGAGTLNVTGWQYFNEQGLFIFDIIILVYAARFTEIDVTVMKHCERYHIPLFIVRSKADHQIKSILEDKFGYDEDEEDAREIYKRYHSAARQLLIDSTRQNLDENLAKAKLMKREVFIISSNSMHALMTERWNRRSSANVIDESKLLEAVLKAAHTRRYGTEASTKDHSSVVLQNMAESQFSTGAFGS